MEVELEEERKLRTSAQAAKRKLDSQVSELEGQLENANKIKEEGTSLHNIFTFFKKIFIKTDC